MPVPENEEPSKSLPVALQSLFYKVRNGRKGCWRVGWGGSLFLPFPVRKQRQGGPGGKSSRKQAGSRGGGVRRSGT